MGIVRQERSGWRDEGISARHRSYGFNVPVMDLDYVHCEYNYMMPVALFEYKMEHAPEQKTNSPSHRVIENLGNMAKLPSFACRYAQDYSWWTIVPINDHAESKMRDRFRGQLKDDTVTVPEISFVEFLYWLRGETMPPGIFSDTGDLF